MNTFNLINNDEESLIAKYRCKINDLTTSVPHHIETSQLISIADQLTSLYMRRKNGR